MRAMSMNHRDGKRDFTFTRQELMMNKLEQERSEEKNEEES